MDSAPPPAGSRAAAWGALVPRDRRGRRLLAAVLAAAFAARLAYGLLKPPPGGAAVRYGAGFSIGDWDRHDPDGYVRLSMSVAEGWRLYEDGRPSAHREPGFPVIMGLLFRIFGARYLTLLAANAVFGTLALWALYAVGARLLGPAPALAAAAAGALYPPFLYYAAQPLRETLMLLAGATSILAALEAGRRRTAAAWTAAGLVNALAGLTNTTLVPFGAALVPGVLVCLELRDKRRPLPGSPAPPSPPRMRVVASRAAAYLAVYVLLYGLWPLRNHRALGEWVLGSTAGAGSTFYTYLIVPQEVGGTARHAEILAADPVTREGGALDPVAKERFFWKAGWARVRREPMAWLRLVAWRFFWDQWRPVPRPRAYSHAYAVLWWVSLLTDGWIIPLGLLGIALARLRPPENAFPILLVLSIHSLHSLVITMLRYRLSLMPWLILFAAYALVECWGRLGSVKRLIS